MAMKLFLYKSGSCGLKFAQSNQSQSARSQRWFDIDFDWFGVNFSTREPGFYKETFSDP